MNGPFSPSRHRLGDRPFSLTPLHGSRSKTGKNDYAKKVVLCNHICKINVPSAGEKTGISHS